MILIHFTFFFVTSLRARRYRKLLSERMKPAYCSLHFGFWIFICH